VAPLDTGWRSKFEHRGMKASGNFKTVEAPRGGASTVGWQRLARCWCSSAADGRRRSSAVKECPDSMEEESRSASGPKMTICHRRTTFTGRGRQRHQLDEFQRGGGLRLLALWTNNVEEARRRRWCTRSWTEGRGTVGQHTGLEAALSG
jgi:hypothetical protein